MVSGGERAAHRASRALRRGQEEKEQGGHMAAKAQVSRGQAPGFSARCAPQSSSQLPASTGRKSEVGCRRCGGNSEDGKWEP